MRKLTATTQARILLAAFAMLMVSGVATQAMAQSSSCDAPQVLMVLDRSSSMGARAPLADGTLKWTAAVTAITEITSDYESSIDFGLSMFPGPGGFCEPGVIDVPVAPSNAAAVTGALGDAPPYSDWYTPMARSMRVAATYAPMLDDTRRSFVALITDGWEWCDPYDSSTRFAPVEAAEELTAAGMGVFIIGFGSGVDTLALNRAAFAAGTHIPGCDPNNNPYEDEDSDPLTSYDPADNCYMQVDDLAELRAALADIAVEVTEEICDGLDNNCDGFIDEDVTRECTTACGTGTEICTDGVWSSCDGGAPSFEDCDGIDNDCDGIIDEGCACLDDESRPCGSDVGECEPGVQTCVDGRWSECDGGLFPVEETCDGLDNDCDGLTDEEEETECPSGFACVDGECEDIETPPEEDPDPDPEFPPEDGGPYDDDAGPGDGVSDLSNSGCDCHAAPTAAQGGAHAALAALLLGFVAFLRRRSS